VAAAGLGASSTPLERTFERTAPRPAQESLGAGWLGAALGNRTPDLRITRSPGHRSGPATCTDSSARVPERSESTESYRFPVHHPGHDRARLPVTECHLRGRRMALTQGHRLSRRCGQRGRGLGTIDLKAAAHGSGDRLEIIPVRGHYRRAGCASPSTTQASTMSVVAREQRGADGASLVIVEGSTSHPPAAGRRAWRPPPRQDWATTGAGTVGTSRCASRARWRAHNRRSPRSAAMSAPVS
jgi:hypothetical protein